MEISPRVRATMNIDGGTDPLRSGSTSGTPPPIRLFPPLVLKPAKSLPGPSSARDIDDIPPLLSPRRESAVSFCEPAEEEKRSGRARLGSFPRTRSPNKAARLSGRLSGLLFRNTFESLTAIANSELAISDPESEAAPDFLEPGGRPSFSMERWSQQSPIPSPNFGPVASISSSISMAQSGTASHRNSLGSQLRESMDANSQQLHILVAASGSVATIKVPLIINKLRSIYGEDAVIQLMVTQGASKLLLGTKLPSDVKVWTDDDEWNSRQDVLETALHVQLRRWADILLIAPLSANTLAKLATGICDNLISCVFRAWGPPTPVVLAPAMNAHMYANEMTKNHLAFLQKNFSYVTVLKPNEKISVGGAYGMGGMREWTDVVSNVVTQLGVPKSVEEEEREEQERNREKKIKKLRNSGIDFPVELAAKISIVDEDEDEDDDDNDDNEDEDSGEEHSVTEATVSDMPPILQLISSQATL